MPSGADASAGGADFLVTDDFIEAGLCESLIRESRSAEFRQAKFHEPLRDESGSLVDTTTRNVKEMKVSAEARALVTERLLAHKPVLEAHFRVGLGECQRPNFLYYTAGGLYVPHTDSADEPEFPDYIRDRRVSVVIFLNGQADSDADEGFRGGSLIIYTPNYRPRSAGPSTRVRGRAGRLVAFRSNVFHEVEPVGSGERFTVAAWFACPPRPAA